MFHWLRRGLAALGLLAIAGSASAQTVSPAVAVARPALWSVDDADTTIYLFGTIHMLPADYSWRSAALDQALASSESLYVETLIDERNPAALRSELTQLGFRNGLPPVLERVSPDKRAALYAALTRLKLPLATMDRMETWAAAFTLLALQFQAIDLKGSDGVEASLRGSFATARKPVGQLETNREQLGFFDQLSESAQRTLLDGAVDTPEAMRGQFDTMLKAWTSGNVDEIAKAFGTELRESPELRDALLARRNANWTRWIEQRLAQPGQVMVAVGAGHLAGEGSVQDMLEKRGYRVTRLQ